MPNPPAGVPIYGFETLLSMSGLATVGMLKRHRLRPGDGQQPVACYWTGHDYARLYRKADAVALPPLSPGRQRLYDLVRTCAECGQFGLSPFTVGQDGRRYCEPCQDPVHERLWLADRDADRPRVTAWAAGVLADPSVVLVGQRSHTWWRGAYVVDLSGAVLLDARIRFGNRGLDPDRLAHPDLAGTVRPLDLSEQVTALQGRRLISWWPTTDLHRIGLEYDEHDRVVAGEVRTADEDHLGRWYDRWAGELAGSSYRFHPRLAQHPPPWEPQEQTTRMRVLLDEMAGAAAAAAADGAAP